MTRFHREKLPLLVTPTVGHGDSQRAPSEVRESVDNFNNFLRNQPSNPEIEAFTMGGAQEATTRDALTLQQQQCCSRGHEQRKRTGQVRSRGS
jgi:hypothetical protein